jgi:hypothetical protein
MKLISEKADWPFLQNDFPLEGIFHVEKWIVFIEIFLLFECFIIEVEVDVFFVFEMFLFFSKIVVDVFVILSFFKEFSFFARNLIIVGSSVIGGGDFFKIWVSSEFGQDPLFPFNLVLF